MTRRPRKRRAGRRNKRGQVPRLGWRAPPERANRHHNLPPQFTSFIGRHIEIAEIKRLLGTTRLLTLTGVGGCGKTRLALQAAADLLDLFDDGVWFVDLAPLSNPALIPKTIAMALSVPEPPRRKVLDALIDSLRSSKALLILDNCEHVLPSCADIVHSLLRECSDLRILVTSREPLNLKGEIRWTVPCLSMPDTRDLSTRDSALKYDAVRLFVARAAAAHAAFAITDGNAGAIARLCLQLDGIPLAIEMAAAWARILTTEEILSRLSDRFHLLKSRDRVVTPRHQTLKTAMDWSYGLLREAERLLLSRLSVFAGGGTLDATEAICSGNGVDRTSVLSLLTGLVDKSLVTVETSGGAARYRLLEIVRQYGLARLTEAGQADEMRRRHRDWYLSLAEKGASSLRTPDQLTWLQRLDVEHDNLRAALEWSKVEDKGIWLRLASALHQFWFIRGYFTEGREWLEQALSACQTAPASIRALALCGAGLLAWRQGDAKGNLFLQQSLELFRQLNDPWGTAYAVHHLAHVLEESDLGKAALMFEESVALFRKVSDRWGIGWSLLCLADAIILQGDADRAAAPLEESLSLCREVGNMHSLAYVLDHLAVIARQRGDYDRATMLLQEGLTIARQVGDQYHTPFLEYELANVFLARGATEQAFTMLRESLILSREVGDKPRLGVFMRGLARVASAQGDRKKAARLIGVVDGLRGSLSFERLAYDRADYERCVTVTESSVGVKDFAVLRAEGRMMSLEQAINYAVAPTEARRTRSRGPERLRSRREGLIAPRERQVAVLIAEGKTNREIATSLSITEGTVEAHVQHILNKLGVNSRAQIAAWIAAHRTESVPPPA